jgi:hypothetical protein
VIARVKERLAGSKQATQKFVGERFNLGYIISEREVRKHYQIKISNRFAALLKNIPDSKDIIGLGKTLQRI